MPRKKLTPEEEQKRQKILEGITNKLEEINCMLRLMASCYTPKMFELDEVTNKQLERLLKELYKVDEKLEKFRDRHIPDENWDFAEL
jgi:restriction endonuclease S subunit